MSPTKIPVQLNGSTDIRISKPNGVDEYYNVGTEYWQNRRNMEYRK